MIGSGERDASLTISVDLCPSSDTKESAANNTNERHAWHTKADGETAAELARTDVNHGACRSGESGKILQREERRITAASAEARGSKEGWENNEGRNEQKWGGAALKETRAGGAGACLIYPMNGRRTRPRGHRGIELR